MSVGMTLCGVYFRNPVLTASGTYGYGIEFEKQIDLNSLGGIVTKGLSIEPIRGNPAPRLWEAASGMINSVGLQNVGVRHFVAEKLPCLQHFSTNIVINVFGYETEHYEDVVRVLNEG